MDLILDITQGTPKNKYMKIPEQLKIGGHWYEIKFNENRENETGNEHPASSYSRVNKIWIDKNQTISRQESCLLHEIIEMLNYEFQLGLEHKVISQLDSGLYQVLKDNKLNFTPTHR